MNRYDIVIDSDYLSSCTYENKCGMFPTLETLEIDSGVNHSRSLVPTQSDSPIIELFSNYIDRSTIIRRFLQFHGFKNCSVPLSKRYPTLTAIENYIISIWENHDIANYEKFNRMLLVFTKSNDISPLYNKHVTWNINDNTTGKNTRELSSTETNAIDTSDTINKTDSLTKTGTVADSGKDIQKKTGTEQNDIDGSVAKTGTEQSAKNITETHSGTDNTTTSSTRNASETIVNGVTSYDQSENFVNNDNSVRNTETHENGQSSLTHGESIATTGTDTVTYNTKDTTDSTNTTTYNTNLDNTKTNTTTYNTTDSYSAFDMHTVDTDTEKNTTTDITDNLTNKKLTDGERNENINLSYAELMERENKIVPLIDTYLNSVCNEIALCCIEEIW